MYLSPKPLSLTLNSNGKSNFVYQCGRLELSIDFGGDYRGFSVYGKTEYIYWHAVSLCNMHFVSFMVQQLCLIDFHIVH